MLWEIFKSYSPKENVHRWCFVFCQLLSCQDRSLIHKCEGDKNIPLQSNNLLLWGTHRKWAGREGWQIEMTPRSTAPRDLHRPSAGFTDRGKTNPTQAERAAFWIQTHTHTHWHVHSYRSGGWEWKPSHADCFSRWEKRSRKKISSDNAINRKL